MAYKYKTGCIWYTKEYDVDLPLQSVTVVAPVSKTVLVEDGQLMQDVELIQYVSFSHIIHGGSPESDLKPGGQESAEIIMDVYSCCYRTKGWPSQFYLTNLLFNLLPHYHDF